VAGENEEVHALQAQDPLEGAPEFFESLDAARQFLLGKSKDAIVRGLDTGRYSGRSLEQFPPGNIRHSVEALLALQRRFPLDTANNLRGRLRRMKFNLYKKGSKGVSYICAVRRRFRDPQTVLADHVQKLITFIEQHPLTPASRLPHEFLGLPLPAEKKPAEPVAPVAIAPTPGTPASADAEPTTEAVSPPVEKSAPAVETQNSKPETLFTPEQTQQFRDLVINLRWLVMEGYVVEYGDGRLFAPPPLPAPKAKAANEGEVPAEAEAPSSPDEEIIEDTAPSSDGDSNGVTDDVGEAEFTDVLDTPAAAEAAAPSEAPPSDPPASAV